jgi:hypothetical protein
MNPLIGILSASIIISVLNFVLVVLAVIIALRIHEWIKDWTTIKEFKKPKDSFKLFRESLDKEVDEMIEKELNERYKNQLTEGKMKSNTRDYNGERKPNITPPPQGNKK